LITLVWDVDDVLNDLTRRWLEDAWRPAHPDADVAYADLTRQSPAALLGVAETEYLASLDDFRARRYAALDPDPEVLGWFTARGADFRHVALTATPMRHAPAVAAWVLGHFGPWIRAFAVLPSPRPGESLPVYDRDKGGVLAWLGVGDVFIDDSPANVAAVAARGVRTVLAPRPWNDATVPLLTALQANLGAAQPS
jgi:hypothetical protein